MRVDPRRPPFIPYRPWTRPPGVARPRRLAFRGLGRLGDTPATFTQIEDAGYDPNDPNTTYTIDSTGNLQANPVGVTITSSASGSGTASQPPISPLLLVLAAVFGVTYYAGSQHGKRA